MSLREESKLDSCTPYTLGEQTPCRSPQRHVAEGMNALSLTSKATQTAQMPPRPGATGVLSSVPCATLQWDIGNWGLE